MVPRVGTEWADLGQSPLSRKHLRHTGNLVRQPLPVCCRHTGKRSDGSGLASDRSNPSRNHVGNTPRSRNRIGWCRSTSFSTGGRSPHPGKRGPFRAVPGVRDGVFWRIPPVPGPARPIPTFSTVAAADKKWHQGPRAVLGVSEGGIRLGDPQALLARFFTNLLEWKHKYFLGLRWTWRRRFNENTVLC